MTTKTKLKPGPRKSQMTRETEQYIAGLLVTDEWNHGEWTLKELHEQVIKAGKRVSKDYLYRIVERLGYTSKWVRR